MYQMQICVSVHVAVVCALFCHSSEVCQNRSPLKGMGDGGSERPAGASQATDADSAPEDRSTLADGTLDKVFHGFPYWHCRRDEEQRNETSCMENQRSDNIRVKAFMVLWTHSRIQKSTRLAPID